MDYVCPECGRELKSESGLKAHITQSHSRQAGELQFVTLEENNTMEEELQDQTTGKFETLANLFGTDKRGLLSPPPTDDELKRRNLNSMRLSVVQTMQVLIEIADLLHPNKLNEVISEFSDEPDFRRILILDWLDWTYRSYGKVHSLNDLLVKTLKREAVDAGIISEDESLPDTPQTKLGPVLEELASRISVSRR